MTMRDANFPRNFKHSVGNIGKEFFVVLQTADAIYRKIFRLYFEILTFNYNFNILVPIDADFMNDFMLISFPYSSLPYIQGDQNFVPPLKV